MYDANPGIVLDSHLANAHQPSQRGENLGSTGVVVTLTRSPFPFEIPALPPNRQSISLSAYKIAAQLRRLLRGEV